MTVGDMVHRFLRRHVSLMGSTLSVTTREPVVVLTYDDGPEPGQTERVLAALDERGAHATFFMLSRRARAHPELVEAVVRQGHEIALHGRDHRTLTTFSPAEVTTRTSEARAELEDVSGRSVRWIRPPYGRQSPSTYWAVRRAGLWPVMWSATLRDTVDGSAAERVASATAAARPGVILLAHDGRAGAEDGVADGDIEPFDRGELARRVLDGFAVHGLCGVSLGEALEAGTVRRGAWFG